MLIEGIFLGLVILGGYRAGRLIFPDLLKAFKTSRVPPHAISISPLSIKQTPVTPVEPSSESPQPPPALAFEPPETLEERYHKLEILLNEKNQIITKLETRFKNACEDREEFEKIKALLEEQIVELREQNRTLKLDAGIKGRFSFQEIPD